MKQGLKYLLFLFALAVPMVLAAQDVINAKEAADLSRSKEVLLISARQSTDYIKVHAPNSINIDPAVLVDDMSMLKPAAVNASYFGTQGVSNAKHLVIYDDGSMKSAGRLYWIFKYMGVEKVSVVDGGMKAWRINRLPVTKNPTVAKKASFTPKIKQQYLADYNTVTKAIGQAGYVILDVRTPEEYNGTAAGYDVPGHIPGAINIDHTRLLTAKGELKAASELKTMFEAYGVTSNKKVIVYCRTSVRAGIVFLGLHSVLDYPNVMVYDGAYTEWMKRAPGNVETE